MSTQRAPRTRSAPARRAEIARQLGQVHRQPGADHDRVGAARAGLAHVVRVLRHRAHDVDRDHAAPARRSRARRGSRGRARVGWPARSSRGRASGRVARIRSGWWRRRSTLEMVPTRPARDAAPPSRCADTPTPMPPCTSGSNARPRMTRRRVVSWRNESGGITRDRRTRLPALRERFARRPSVGSDGPIRVDAGQGVTPGTDTLSTSRRRGRTA